MQLELFGDYLGLWQCQGQEHSWKQDIKLNEMSPPKKIMLLQFIRPIFGTIFIATAKQVFNRFAAYKPSAS